MTRPLSPLSGEATQRAELEALIAAAEAARDAADRNALLDSPAGYRLWNAMHDLTGCDALYGQAGDIAHDCGIPHEPHWRETLATANQTRRWLERGR